MQRQKEWGAWGTVCYWCDRTCSKYMYVPLHYDHFVLQGTGDEVCHFRIDRYKERGFVTIESMANRGMFVGMLPDGRVRPTVDTGDKNVRFYPEVIECK